jgi:hypothetical protein
MRDQIHECRREDIVKVLLKGRKKQGINYNKTK